MHTDGERLAFLFSNGPSLVAENLHKPIRRVATCSLDVQADVRRPSASLRKMHGDRIVGFSKLGDLHAMQVALTEAEKDGLELNVVLCTAIANAYAVAGKKDQLLNTFRTMLEKRIQPSNVTLSVAAKGLKDPNDLVWVVEWFKRDSCEPGYVRTWNLVLRTLSQQPQMDHDGALMMRVFQMMSREGVHGGPVPLPDEYSFNSVIEGWRRRKNMDFALCIYARMVLSRNVKPDIVTYNSLLVGFLTPTGTDEIDFQSSVRLLRFLIALPDILCRDNLRPDNIMVTLSLKAALCQHKTIAKKTWSADNVCSPRLSNRDGTVSLVRSIWRAAPPNPGLFFYNSLIAAFAQLGDLQSALRALQEMKVKSKLEPDISTYNSLISAAARVGNSKLVDHLLNQTKHESNISADDFTYSAVLSAYGGNPGVCLKILQQALESGVKCTAPMMNAAIACYGMDVDGALKQWRAWRQHEAYAEAARSVQVYRALMRVAGTAGRPDMGLRIILAGKRSGELEPTIDMGLFGSFTKGLREGWQLEKVRSNFVSRQYLNHLRLECRAFDSGPELPFERVRIRW